MSRSLTIRPAQMADAEGIGRVHVETWQVAYRGQVPDSYLDGLNVEQRIERWRSMLADPDRDETNWVALDDAKVIGFSGAGTSRDHDADARTGELFAIYVNPSYWDTGAGEALLDAAMAFLRERFDAAMLWVLDTNVRARRFYEKHGWS